LAKEEYNCGGGNRTSLPLGYGPSEPPVLVTPL